MKFAEDSLFCEWAYFMDFEYEIFEVWKGMGPGDAGGVRLRKMVTFHDLKVRGNFMDSLQAKLGNERSYERGLEKEERRLYTPFKPAVEYDELSSEFTSSGEDV